CGGFKLITYLNKYNTIHAFRQPLIAENINLASVFRTTGKRLRIVRVLKRLAVLSIIPVLMAMECFGKTSLSWKGTNLPLSIKISVYRIAHPNKKALRGAGLSV
ncbi:MAG: hypothetical protein ACREUY_10385, partial [Burkholderiales bacterium]